MYVWFQYKYNPKERPIPHPYHYSDKWDSYHVRMPCSNQSEFPVNNKVFVLIDYLYKVLIGSLYKLLNDTFTSY